MKLTRSFCRIGRLLNSFENRVVTVWNVILRAAPLLSRSRKKLENYDLSNFCTVSDKFMYSRL